VSSPTRQVRILAGTGFSNTSTWPQRLQSSGASLAAKGVRVMRLPQVHNTVKQGLVTYAIELARQKGVSRLCGRRTQSLAGFARPRCSPTPQAGAGEPRNRREISRGGRRGNVYTRHCRNHRARSECASDFGNSRRGSSPFWMARRLRRAKTFNKNRYNLHDQGFQHSSGNRTRFAPSCEPPSPKYSTMLMKVLLCRPGLHRGANYLLQFLPTRAAGREDRHSVNDCG
jgi:hypothetical protein